MPTFKELLEDSMVFEAARVAPDPFMPQEVIDVPPGPFEFDPPPRIGPEVEDDDAETKPIWHWKLGDKPTEIAELSCVTRAMEGCQMVVCDRISFADAGGVTVTRPGRAPVQLPLTEEFLVSRHHLHWGVIDGSNKMYPLEAEVDRSFLWAFAYEIHGFKAPRAVAPEVLKSPAFMPEPESKGLWSRVWPGQTAIATVAPFRAVVLVQLVCCKEKANFDPGGALGAGRFYANLMVMANQPLEQVRGGVRHSRPAKTSMVMPNGMSMAMADMREMQMADMNDAPGIILFADRNDTDNPVPLPEQVLPPPLPTWDNIFTHYDLDPAEQELVAVDPARGEKRTVRDAVEVLKNMPESSVYIGPKWYVRADVEKEPGQAEYDNIHAAPTMRVPAAMTADDEALRIWRTQQQFAGKPWSLDKITMAPFCVHDCFHIHWRWGTFSTALQARGWSDGRPYSKRGAPQVPENQTVKIKIISKVAFDYIAEANARHGAIEPGTWTYVNHHGASYALAERSLKTWMAHAAVAGLIEWPQGEPDVGATLSEWSVFYWHLRFGGLKATKSPDRPALPQERLRFTPEQLKRLRDA